MAVAAKAQEKEDTMDLEDGKEGEDDDENQVENMEDEDGLLGDVAWNLDKSPFVRSYFYNGILVHMIMAEFKRMMEEAVKLLEDEVRNDDQE